MLLNICNLYKQCVYLFKIKKIGTHENSLNAWMFDISLNNKFGGDIVKKNEENCPSCNRCKHTPPQHIINIHKIRLILEYKIHLRHVVSQPITISCSIIFKSHSNILHILKQPQIYLNIEQYSLYLVSQLLDSFASVVYHILPERTLLLLPLTLLTLLTLLLAVCFACM